MCYMHYLGERGRQGGASFHWVRSLPRGLFRDLHEIMGGCVG